MSYSDKYEAEYLRKLVKSQARDIIVLQNTINHLQRRLDDKEKGKS